MKVVYIRVKRFSDELTLHSLSCLILDGVSVFIYMYINGV